MLDDNPLESVIIGNKRLGHLIGFDFDVEKRHIPDFSADHMIAIHNGDLIPDFKGNGKVKKKRNKNIAEKRPGGKKTDANDTENTGEYHPDIGPFDSPKNNEGEHNKNQNDKLGQFLDDKPP